MVMEQKYRLENLRNRTQELVITRIEQVLAAGTDMCTCEQCVLDLLAYTLNHVTPQYGTSLLDPLSPNSEAARKVLIEIELAIEEGLRVVSARPNH